MKELCRQQADLKIAHIEQMEDLEVESERSVAAIREESRLKRRELRGAYRKEQLELECEKQQLKTDYLLEHPEEDAA